MNVLFVFNLIFCARHRHRVRGRASIPTGTCSSEQICVDIIAAQQTTQHPRHQRYIKHGDNTLRRKKHYSMKISIRLNPTNEQNENKFRLFVCISRICAMISHFLSSIQLWGASTVATHMQTPPNGQYLWQPGSIDEARNTLRAMWQMRFESENVSMQRRRKCVPEMKMECRSGIDDRLR